MTENQTKKEEDQSPEEVSKIWQEILKESAMENYNQLAIKHLKAVLT